MVEERPAPAFTGESAPLLEMRGIFLTPAAQRAAPDRLPPGGSSCRVRRRRPALRLSHAEMKQRARTVRFAVRTGEFTPYANAILVVGVPF